MKYRVNRDVTRKECPWLNDTVKKGITVYRYHGATYGCVATGIAVSLEDGQIPFFELPIEALAVDGMKIVGNKKLKLFVWDEFCPDYSDGLAFAIAETVQEAQELVINSMGYSTSSWGPVREYPIAKIARSVSGGS